MPSERLAKLQARIRAILEKAQTEEKAKRDAGLCVWPNCVKAALKDNSQLFFGMDHCDEHARKAEIEALLDEQEDDANGRL